MADLINNFPNWGETGSYPSDGFFYQGGDQVNEKHMDALWNGIDVHVANFNSAIRNRVRDLNGDKTLGRGLQTSKGGGTREVDVTSAGVTYVDGERVENIPSTTTSHSANGTGSLRTDVIHVDDTGSISKTEGTTTPPVGEMKIAEVDVDTNDSIVDIRNFARHHSSHVSVASAPGTSESGDLWHDEDSGESNIYQNGSWQTILTEEYDVTVSGGDGLKNGSTQDLANGATFSLDIEPADFAGAGLQDDGADNLELTNDSVTVAGNSVSLGGSTGIALGDLSNVTATGEGSGNGFDADTVDGQHAADITISREEAAMAAHLFPNL